MDDNLYLLLKKLTREQLIALMWNSLDEMQAWNGRSKTACICMALGCAVKTDEDGEEVYSLASVRKAKDNCSSCFLGA